MVSFEDLRAMVLALPDTVETTSWDARSFKVNGKVILFWNPTHDCPVFKVALEERDFLIEVDPETFFTTDHHRPWPLVLARPDRLDHGWARANIERVWRAQVKKRTLMAYDAGRAGSLSLAERSGLPDPLRVLVEQYPRTAWESHPHFTALTRFWLDRHLGFRRLQGLLVAETEGFLDRGRQPLAYARGLARLAGTYLSELHGHHTIEDHHYFPFLKTLDARLAPGFELLDADHHVLDAAMHALAEATNAVLLAVREARPAEDAAGALFGQLAGFGRLVDRHLTDEEELVVPVILDHPEAGL